MPLKGEAKAAWQKRWKTENKDKVAGYRKVAAAKKPKKERQRGPSAAALQRRKRTRQDAKNRRLKGARGRVLEILGAQCAHCGNDDKRVLQVDHVNGDGYKTKQRANEMLRSLARGEVAKRYQVLCANCHCIKTSEKGEGKARTNGVYAPLPLFDGLEDKEGSKGLAR